MIRDTIAKLRDGHSWRLEVADEAGTIRHLFPLTAEIFDPQGRLSWQITSDRSKVRYWERTGLLVGIVQSTRLTQLGPPELTLLPVCHGPSKCGLEQ
jgi:hypothetical protein